MEQTYRALVPELCCPSPIRYDISMTNPTPTTNRDGTKKWYLNGEWHRPDGPAVEWASGTKEWCFKGRIHRTDGPALEFADGRTEWWVNGEPISTPYSQVLTAAFASGLHIPPEVLPEVFKAMSEAQGSQNHELNQLYSIINKHWPMHVKKILAALFSDTDPRIKNLAFSLLGCQARAENTQGGVRL